VTGTPFHHFQSEWGNAASYSAAVRVGDLIWTCGQLGAEPSGPPVDFEVQAVEEAGGSIQTIVKINGYLASMSQFPAYDRIYRSVIGGRPMPARTTVQIGGFVEPVLVEVDAVALAR
jgi:2-iminobutanoate/2-iminopropanoate deaminase